MTLALTASLILSCLGAAQPDGTPQSEDITLSQRNMMTYLPLGGNNAAMQPRTMNGMSNQDNANLPTFAMPANYVSGIGLVPNQSAVKKSLRFGVISDTHIGASKGSASHYPNSDRLIKALDWYGMQNVDAVAIVGDITDKGSAAQWDAFKNSIDGRLDYRLRPAPKKPKLVPALGNHDSSPLEFEAGTGEKTNTDYVINGYHFITVAAGGATAQDGAAMMWSTSGGDGSTHDVNTLNWLRARINAAKSEDPKKPIFVFMHHPVRNTFYVSHEWYTDSYGTADSNYFFKDDPQVVVFSGHIHSPNNDPRSIWQGGFTSVNTVTLYYCEMEKGYLGMDSAGTDGSTYPKIQDAAMAQGLIVDVEGPVVTIKNYDFDVSADKTDNVYQIPQTWTFDISSPANFPYTNAMRERQKRSPVFDAGAGANAALPGKITIDSIGKTNVTVTFPQAAMPTDNPGNEVVHSYKFEFRNLATGSVERTVKQWSDFMMTEYLRKPNYTQLIGGLATDTEYELRIYAYGSFQKESAQCLTATFKTN
jgi:3',5'-cyclic AMP phosphodiesterase CpdA